MTRRGILACVALALLVGACASPVEAPPPRTATSAALPSAADTGSGEPAGRVRVVVPEEPAAWWNPASPDVAADDLTRLWGLPLLRVDEHGQFRRGLVVDWTVVGEVDGDWAVDLRLAEGTWSDGTPVRPTDVAATLVAARDRDPGRFGTVVGAEPADDGQVRIRFEQPTATWADLLVAVGPVLPATEVEGAAERFADAIPVSAGLFRLASYEPGLRAVFEAHDGSPLGTPRLAVVEVLFAPRYETALALLEAGDADVAVGYLALNPVARAEEVEGVEAAAPIGGTTVSLAFAESGTFGAPDDAVLRRGIRDVLDVDLLVEGLLGETGEVASSPWPEVPLPGPRPAGELDTDRSVVLVLPGSNDVLSFTARAVERDLTNVGMAADVVAEPTPRFSETAGTVGDVALVTERTTRHPPLGPLVVGADARASAAAATMAGWPSDEARAALDAVVTEARSLALFRPGVLHAWQGVDGIRPSAWPGAGFWNVGEWALVEPA